MEYNVAPYGQIAHHSRQLNASNPRSLHSSHPFWSHTVLSFLRNIIIIFRNTSPAFSSQQLQSTKSGAAPANYPNELQRSYVKP
jgi:hypothetical protein